MFTWLKEYLELQYEFKAKREICDSCETLKRQLEIANHEKSILLNKLINPLTVPPVPIERDEPRVILPKTISWNVRRQMLEAEDRKKAELMKSAPKADVTKLEAEVINAEKTN